MASERTLEKIKERFPDAVKEVIRHRGEIGILVKTTLIRDICMYLRDENELRYDMIIDISGLDRHNPKGELLRGGYVNDPFDRLLKKRDDSISPDERYEVVYHLYSNKNKEYLRIKVRVPETSLKVQSVVSVWPGADWHERETYDMFGILFEEHPDLRRIYMPDYFEYFPLRKDFPLMGIPGSLPLPDKH